MLGFHFCVWDLWLWDCSPPARSCEGVWKTERTQNIRGNEVKDGTSTSLAHSSGSIDPFFVGDHGAIVRIGDVDVRDNRWLTLFLDALHLFGKDCSENVDGWSDLCFLPILCSIFFGAGLLSIIMIFLKRYRTVVKGAHLGTSVCDDSLTGEFALLVGEARITSI